MLNSGYSVLYAAQQFKDEGASSEACGKMDTDEMLRIVKANRGRPESDYISEKIPTLTKTKRLTKVNRKYRHYFGRKFWRAICRYIRRKTTFT